MIRGRVIFELAPHALVAPRSMKIGAGQFVSLFETAILGSVIFELATHAQRPPRRMKTAHVGRWFWTQGWGRDVDDRGRGPATEDRATVVAVIVDRGGFQRHFRISVTRGPLDCDEQPVAPVVYFPSGYHVAYGVQGFGPSKADFVGNGAAISDRVCPPLVRATRAFQMAASTSLLGGGFLAALEPRRVASIDDGEGKPG